MGCINVASRRFGRTRVDSRGTIAGDPVVEAPERALLLNLAEDPEPSVRELAAYDLVRLDPPLEESAYLRLLGSEDPRVRGALTLASTVDRAFLSVILVKLASDPSQEVRGNVDARLGREQQLDPFLESLRIRLVAEDINADYLQVMLPRIYETRPGRLLVVALTLSQEAP